MLVTRFVAKVLAVGLLVFGAGVASGQDYPSKPIRMVVPGAGGGTDFTARIIAQGIAGPLGQQVIVDNRATTFLASEAAYKAPPDGYTLHVNGTSIWTTPLLRQTPYDVTRDFSPISQLVREVSVLAVHPSLPVKSVKELIALAKARPGELNYASTTAGAPAHLATELFKALAGINIVHVPYKGTAASITAVLNGDTQMTITDMGSLAMHVKSGRLRALAVTTAQPSALIPGLPTVADSGLPGYEVVNMTGIWAPANTPVAIISRLNREIVRVLNQPDVKARFFNAGVEVVGSSPEELAAIVKSEIAKMSKVIKDAGIKAD